MVIHPGQVAPKFKVNKIISNCGECNLSQTNVAPNEAAVVQVIYACRLGNNRRLSEDHRLSLSKIVSSK